MHKLLIRVLTLIVVGLGCRAGETKLAKERADSVARIRVTSSAFEDGQPIPDKYATKENVSPPIAWENLPPGTKYVALMVEDPDAPGVHPFVHWIIYNIPGSETGLSEGVPPKEELDTPKDARQGKNSTLSVGYHRPAPPPGDKPHRYHFQVFALGRMLEADGAPMGRAEFLRQITGQVLASGEIVGTYQRAE